VQVVDRRDLDGREVEFVTEVGDYRPVSGLVFPHRMEVGRRAARTASGSSSGGSRSTRRSTTPASRCRSARPPCAARPQDPRCATLTPAACLSVREVLHGLVDLGSRRSRPARGGVTTPGGFFAIFFGAGAILVGALKALGWEGPAWAEWLVFTVLSLFSLGFFRQAPHAALQPLEREAVDRMEGERALVTEDVAPGGVGKAEMRGATWTARTTGELPLGKGCRCRVERVEGSPSGCGPSREKGDNDMSGFGGAFLVFVFLALFVFYLIAKTAVVVPQQHAFVVERLGRFAGCWTPASTSWSPS